MTPLLDVLDLRMEDASAACGLHVTPVISEWPQAENEADTMAAQELAAGAREIADWLASRTRHVPADSIRDLASCICDGLECALQDVGGRLDMDEFMNLAGVAP